MAKVKGRVSLSGHHATGNAPQLGKEKYPIQKGKTIIKKKGNVEKRDKERGINTWTSVRGHCLLCSHIQHAVYALQNIEILGID